MTGAPDTNTGQLTCFICHDVMNTDEDNFGLVCAHVFHSECVERYRDSVGCPMSDLHCPICKHTELEISSAARLLDTPAEMNLEGPPCVLGAAARSQHSGEAAQNAAMAPALENRIPVALETPSDAVAPVQPLVPIGAPSGTGDPASKRCSTVLCQTCGGLCQLDTARLLSKTKPSWRCKLCSAEVSILDRAICEVFCPVKEFNEPAITGAVLPLA